MRPSVAALSVFSLLLAGCAGGGASPTSDSGGPVASGEPIPDAGSISGVVVDDTTAPLADAQVAIVGLGVSTMTDAAGAFAFGNLAPGAYTLNALKLGYATSAKQVQVEANKAVESVVLTLAPIPIVEPYQETFGPFSGYFECHIGSVGIMSCAGDTINPTLDRILFPNNKRFMFYDLSADNWETQWGEARWSPSAVGTGSGLAIYPSYSKRYDDGNTGHWYCEATGQSPIWFRYDALEERSVCTSTGDDDPPAKVATNPLMVVADPGFQNLEGGEVVPRILIQQKFEVVMTIFYGEPAPEEFTAFPDA